ncbi:MAG: DUF302 domain-containing protein [Acidobacteriota bacterium]
MRETDFGYVKLLRGVNLPAAEEKVAAALKQEGFGVLTRIDVREALKEKLGVDFKPYVILGACNPSLAHRALSQDETIGLLLPCNVVLSQSDAGTEVALARPKAMFRFVDDPALAPLAEEAEAKIARVFASL